MSYNSARFGVNFSGINARAFKQGSDVNWDLDQDSSEAFADARGGQGIIVHNNNTKGKCTVTLQANDPCIPLWVAAYEAAKLSGAKTPLMMYDRNEETKAVAFAANSTMTKRPALTRGTGEPTVEIVFTFPSCTGPYSA